MKYLVTAMLFAILLAGCSKNLQLDRPSDLLINDGMTYFDNEDFLQAITLFENAILNANDPEHARIAQRMLAESYFQSENFMDAIAAFEVYLDLYTTESGRGEILFRLGVSYYHLMLHPRRDQTNTYLALGYFDELKSYFPDKYEELGAGEYVINLRNNLGQSEYQVARFYNRLRSYDAAIGRLQYIINNYPDTDAYPDALALLVEIEVLRVSNFEAALKYLEDLIKIKPNHRMVPALQGMISNTKFQVK